MGRGGREKVLDGPERRCIATGRSGPAERLIRFVVSPEGQLVPDLAGRLPGRGIWVSARRAALEMATGKRLFARAARQPVQMPEDLPARVEALLAQRVVELVSLARKAGLAVAGYEKTRSALAAGGVAALVQASDGSERGKTRLRPPGGEATHVTCLTASEIGLAFGREHVIHAALMAGTLSARVVEEAARLSGVREMSAPVTGGPVDGEPGENGVGDT
ncbi:MAG: hypothetical protein CVT80_06795 [Alphaproteobacteria bacterium HGW-Alphaproteobacteria-2]|nr:MAG: hypothetical protein CVT80_06795 [Alphaproteobacteria bacterium HGW-Alphaproteobacteria-2]